MIAEMTNRLIRRSVMRAMLPCTIIDATLQAGDRTILVLTRYASILKAQRDKERERGDRWKAAQAKTNEVAEEAEREANEAKREAEILARHSVRADIHHAKCVQLDGALAAASVAARENEQLRADAGRWAQVRDAFRGQLDDVVTVDPMDIIDLFGHTATRVVVAEAAIARVETACKAVEQRCLPYEHSHPIAHGKCAVVHEIRSAIKGEQ